MCDRYSCIFYLRLKVAWAAQVCVHFMKVLSVNALNPHLSTLKAYITTQSYVFIVYWNIMKPLKDKDYCPIEIIKGLTDKGQFQYLTNLMGPQEGTYLYATQFHSLR